MIFVGEVFSLFILAVAAIETAIALCIILSYYRLTNKTYNISRNNDIFFSGAVFLSVQKWNTGVVISIVPAFYFILGMIVVLLILGYGNTTGVVAEIRPAITHSAYWPRTSILTMRYIHYYLGPKIYYYF